MRTYMPEIQAMNCSRASASKIDRRRTNSRAGEPGNASDSHRRPEAHRAPRHGGWADKTSSTAVSAAPLSLVVTADSLYRGAAIAPSNRSRAERSNRNKQCQRHYHGHANQYCFHKPPPHGAVWAAPLECASERDQDSVSLSRVHLLGPGKNSPSHDRCYNVSSKLSHGNNHRKKATTKYETWILQVTVGSDLDGLAVSMCNVLSAHSCYVTFLPCYNRG